MPLRLFFSVQNGRQYLMAYLPGPGRVQSFRTDSILSVEAAEVCERFDEYRKVLDGMMPHLWGASLKSRSGQRVEHVEFTVRYGDREKHIHQRLEREKRCGTVERIDEHTSRFSADVYDAGELIPWIRTFICRITEVRFSDKEMEERFRKDLEEMYRMYGIEGGEANDLQ